MEKKVLVVDDELQIRDMYAQLFSKADRRRSRVNAKYFVVCIIIL